MSKINCPAGCLPTALAKRAFSAFVKDEAPLFLALFNTALAAGAFTKSPAAFFNTMS